MERYPINILIDDSRWKPLGPEELVLKAYKGVSEVLEVSENNPVFSVTFTNDAQIQHLNKTYRHQDKPTNVLSFPSLEQSLFQEEEELGDIFLAFETIEHEAHNQNKALNDHTLHLIIHGILHLLGYDHEQENEALEMETLEIEILKKLNIDNPYKES
jgi:probable rRNA maturation factor